jgi:hypothetical protein
MAVVGAPSYFAKRPKPKNELRNALVGPTSVGVALLVGAPPAEAGARAATDCGLERRRLLRR